MRCTTIATSSLLLTLSTLLTTTSAFPSRTSCLCTIVSNSNAARYHPESLPTSEDPSAIPSEYTSAAPSDICSTLGLELEGLRASRPQQYNDLIEHARSSTRAQHPTSTDEELPLSTTVLLQLSVQNAFANLGLVLPSSSPEEDGKHPRIVCRVEKDAESTYSDSLITSFVVQVILGLVILACAAECVTLFLRRNSQDASYDHVPERPALRLSGDEKRLYAVASDGDIFSPGVAKKQRSYRDGTWTPRSGGSKKEFEAYASTSEESDDELSRPVM